MKTCYQLPAEAECPVDGKTIRYWVSVTLSTSRDRNAMIEVEKLKPLIQELTKDPVMQEPLTRAIRMAVCGIVGATVSVSVRTYGTHSGVMVTCDD